MDDLILSAADKAATIARSSTHPKERVGACLFAPSDTPDSLQAFANVIPPALRTHFPKGHRLGSASLYLHSEIAALFASERPTQNMHLAVTTPPCPNCAKMIVEAGINAVYIDYNGLSGEFARQRANDIKRMSLEIFRRAGVSVAIVNRKKNVIRPLFSNDRMPMVSSLSGIAHYTITDQSNLYTLAKQAEARYEDEAYALARVDTATDGTQAYCVLESLSPGITPARYERSKTAEGKYRFAVDPLNRLLIHAKRTGFHILDEAILCSLHPSSRALVNAVAFGIKHISVLSAIPDHGKSGPDAAKALGDKDILCVVTSNPDGDAQTWPQPRHGKTPQPEPTQ